MSSPPSRVAYLDANVVIRFVESEDMGLLFLFEQAAIDAVRLVTSEMTLAEVLVVPRRERDDRLVSIYEDLLKSDDILDVVPIDRVVLRRSAEVRAMLGNKGPDAIHIASALLSGCNIFVSSDSRLKLPQTLTQLEIEYIRDLDRWP